MYGRIASVLLAVLLFSVLSVGCSNSEGSSAVRPASKSSVDTTVGPLGLDETATVGPYEITLTRARLITDPVPGPDLAGVPPMSAGQLLANIWVAVHNPQAESLPLPLGDGFRLETSDGALIDSDGVGLSRSQPTTSDPGSMGTAQFMSTPLRPGETLTLELQYVLDSDPGALTLYFTVSDGNPRQVVVFTIN